MTTITIYTQSSRQTKAYEKTMNVIESCTDVKHLPTTKNMIINFWYKFKNGHLYKNLYTAYLAKQDEFICLN